MAAQQDGTPTPKIVETHATEEVILGRITLLGTFGSANAPSALVLLPQGITRSVKLGDEIAGGKVAAIETTRLVLSRMGTQQILTMPQS